MPTDANQIEDDSVEELEDASSVSQRLIKPWDPKQIRITTKNYTLREVYSQLDENELDLAPDFQRSFVWHIRQQVRLIESILLGIPLPAFYFNLDASGGMQVIDGVQRLTTVKRFMSDRLALARHDLEYLHDFADAQFNHLDSATRRRFQSTQIVAHVIEPQTPDEVKYDIFNRVNTGGSPLKPQEIRHCMSRSRSRRFLKTLIESDDFSKATQYAFWSRDLSQRRDHRMTDRELALRFCAFLSVSIDEYAKASSLDSFLLEFTRRLDSRDSEIDLDRLEQRFNRAMRNSYEILGDAAFRRWPPGERRRGPINRAVFESQSLALSRYQLQKLLPFKDEIVAAFRNLFDDPDYDNSVRSATGDPKRVQLRLDIARDTLRKIVT
ncbi:hypothetical protein M2171_005415 [Bradyrhizobium japonicum USDA 38]|uniref:DUF262 domain-containing protein n=1 Tax=Bradyrhizobium japonicum TaxID=375 RepID=UPI00042078FB|nr:DUF262 domain-containing protein [Bradyrhizobium japonicum]MCS3896282.1 hypothetical protein [Bradyrhizobium japonicum USDA 38]MCS3948796.1 hypothetical protein [Bradyrhizobium japonicum]